MHINMQNDYYTLVPLIEDNVLLLNGMSDKA